MEGGLFMTSNRVFQFIANTNKPLVHCGPNRLTICPANHLSAIEPPQ